MRDIEKGILKGSELTAGTRRELSAAEVDAIYKKAYYSNDILGNFIEYGFLFGVSVGYNKGKADAAKKGARV